MGGPGVDVQNAAWKECIHSRRALGEMLREMPKHPPGPNGKDPSRDGRDPPKLEDLGISYNESARSQDLAYIPPEVLTKAIEAVERPAPPPTAAA